MIRETDREADPPKITRESSLRAPTSRPHLRTARKKATETRVPTASKMRGLSLGAHAGSASEAPLLPREGLVTATTRTQADAVRNPRDSPPRQPDPWARSLEPILIPRLRIHFADFPYLLYPIGQRLFTLKT